eukprot:TRINITY_DN116_c0_g1_i1.p1 TRINITY_DN116_c0_g1~~TRINITY_DN116_c0_g1_i1.p1  ORF type:complete len:264 (+),score=100.19 TRINITY_DN116_c0_g1_i1:24-815(+)
MDNSAILPSAENLLDPKNGDIIFKLPDLPDIVDKEEISKETIDEKKQRLFNLRLKLNKIRDENEEAIREEQREEKETPSVLKKRKRFELKKQEKEEEEKLKEQGIDPKRKKNLEISAEEAEKIKSKRKKRKKNKNYAWCTYTPEYALSSYEKRVKNLNKIKKANKVIKKNKAKYSGKKKLSSEEAQFSILENDNTKQESIDLMSNELYDLIEKREKLKINTFHEDKDVTYINKRNKNFNEKLERSFNKHTVDIRQNLERGTAL